MSNGLNGDRSQAKSLLDKGKQLYRDDQDNEAVAAFQQQVARELAPWNTVGLSYEALDKREDAESQYKKAIEAYKKHIDANPDDAEAHYNLGQTYANLGNYSEAIRSYRQATRLKTDDPDIFYDMGVAHTKLAQYDQAAAAFSKSLEIDPEYYRAQDALEEAREGVKRIRAGKKHQEALLKKQKEEELKKAGLTVPTPTPKG